MTAAELLMTLAGVLVASGAVVTVAAVRHRPDPAGEAPGSGSHQGRRRWTPRPLHLGGAAAGLAALVVTGWPVAGVGAAAAALYVPSVLGGATVSRERVAQSEALSAWTRHLADLIASGAASSTVEAMRRSAASAPHAIAPAVSALVDRLGPQGPETALRRFADEVGDPAADKIAMVLILRERNGGRGLAEVLTGLADDLDDGTRMLREVEAERAKPRANMRTIVGVTAVLVVGMLLFTRPFLSAYANPAGEVALAVVCGLFAWALRWMRLLAQPPASTRVLVSRPSADGAEVSA